MSATRAPIAPKPVKYKSNIAESVWWLNPTKMIAFIILPVFGTAVILGAPMMESFSSYNFLSFGIILLALASLTFLAVGAMLGEQLSKNVKSERVVITSRVLPATYFMALTAIVFHIVMLFYIITTPGIAISVLTGEKGGIYESKDLINQIPGVTSFSATFLLAFALYGAYPHLTKRAPPFLLTGVLSGLFFLILLRSLLMAERFVVIEATMAFAVPRIALGFKKPKLAGWYPVAGFVGVLTLFAIGEYTRSWPFYKEYYANFLEFSYERLIAYLATSTNNAGGALEMSGPVGQPFFTADWLRRLPLWDLIGATPFIDTNPLQAFFDTFGNAAFNNPSGIMAPILDFGSVIGVFVSMMFGVGVGLAYGLFKKGAMIGILLFPIAILGVMIINQALYWTNARVFPALLVTPILILYLSSDQRRMLPA